MISELYYAYIGQSASYPNKIGWRNFLDHTLAKKPKVSEIGVDLPLTPINSIY